METILQQHIGKRIVVETSKRTQSGEVYSVQDGVLTLLDKNMTIYIAVDHHIVMFYESL